MLPWYGGPLPYPYCSNHGSGNQGSQGPVGPAGPPGDTGPTGPSGGDTALQAFGNIGPSGEFISGQGFTSEQTSFGVYELLLDADTATRPSVVVTPFYQSPIGPTLTWTQDFTPPNLITIRFFDALPVPTDTGFSVVVVYTS